MVTMLEDSLGIECVNGPGQGTCVDSSISSLYWLLPPGRLLLDSGSAYSQYLHLSQGNVATDTARLQPHYGST